MKTVLKVFVAEDCAGCAEARAIAGRIQKEYPTLAVEVVELADSGAALPEGVFATPTYMLNNRVVSLGNPKPDEIARWVSKATSRLA